MYEGKKIIAIYDEAMGNVEIYYIEDMGVDIRFYNSLLYIDKYIDVQRGFSYKEAGVEPIFIIARTNIELLVEAFTKIGIRTESDSKMEGKLEAKTEHLNDIKEQLDIMNNLVKRLIEKE